RGRTGTRALSTRSGRGSSRGAPEVILAGAARRSVRVRPARPARDRNATMTSMSDPPTSERAEPAGTAPAAALPDGYDPGQAEERWYRVWEERGYFRADPFAKAKPYCIVIPPPNVTGSLHVGHALDITLQDILIRWKRMDGYN